MREHHHVFRLYKIDVFVSVFFATAAFAAAGNT
jgi:hypothetical protein